MLPRMPSFFASVETARTIERAECALLREVAGVIAEKREGVVVEPIAGGVAVFAGEGAPINKVAGMGFEGLPTEAELESVEHLFHSRGARVQIELTALAEIGVGAMLTKRGYHLAGVENIMVCRPDAHEQGPQVPGVVIDESPDFEQWLDVFVDGFIAADEQGVEAPESFERDAIRSIIEDMAACSTMHHYLAVRDGVPVGGADMRMGDGLAQLCGASTLPAHRRKGVQTALLQHRIAAAKQTGCELMTVSALPGSKSMQNMMKQGFDLAYAKVMLVLEPA